MSKIVIVEDDFRLRQDIREVLEQQGETVLTAENYQNALQLSLGEGQIDLYLVDVMLPDGDGFALCRKLRERTQAPILFLTACSDEESVVRGLEEGGDDYITKPFRVRELLSRIHANLRRNRREQGLYLYSGDLVVNRQEEQVYRQGELLKLSPLEYRLLLMLLEHPGQVLKRELILDTVWDEEGRFVEDNTLSVSMSRLRRKVGQYKENPYWEVVWGVGYRYLLPVQSRTQRDIPVP